MNGVLKIDTATTSFSSCADRFVKGGYKQQFPFEQQLEMIASVDGITGVALDYPSQYEDPAALRALIDPLGLALGMTEIDMYSSAQWRFGSLSSLDDATRDEAIALCKRGVDAAIADLCRQTGQPVPDGPAEMAHAILRSLALEHSLSLQALERASGGRFTALRMVGGGSANALLCQLTADAAGLPVIAGPTEATAAGNILLQARALGLLDEDPAALIDRSFSPTRYEPTGALDPPLVDRYLQIKGARSGD